MVDALVPRTIGPIQRVKKVVPGGGKGSKPEDKKENESRDVDESESDKPRRGTRIDDRV